MNRRLLACAPVSGLLAVVFAVSPAHGIGYWNVPGNVCQCWGYGWGAGYHACFMLGPTRCDECFAHNEVRLPYSPQSPYACSGYDDCCCDQSSMVSPYGYQPAAPIAAPPMAEPVLDTTSPAMTTSPELAPEQLPIPEDYAPQPPIFDAPVER